ncbi:Protein E04D5.4 a [Aphelenchoides avenae]|nr:Protein E04D5.4 a [Aphelenchus avenae]
MLGTPLCGGHSCTTAGTQICYTGCLISSQRNIANGPCANVPGATGGAAANACGILPVGATAGKTCSVVCRSPTTSTSTTTLAPNTHPRCEDANGNLLPNADSCSDEASTTVCAIIEDAVKRCAKTCRICCELPQYSCQDQPQPSQGPTCAENKRRGYCDSFRPLMQTACPATCGLCQSAGAGNCADKTPGCYSLRTYCPDIRYHQYMKDNCAKTCKDYYPNVPGFCEVTGEGSGTGSGGGVDKASNCRLNAGLCNHSLYYKIMTDNCCATCNRCGSGTATNSVASSNQNCVDQSSACVNWNTRGFCDSTFYPQSTKQRYCSRTCGFCR